jgi:hypothetical protein
MSYRQVNCLDTKAVQEIMKEGISLICRNIDRELYPWDEKKGWSKYGIKVVGDRQIIDNPPKEEKKSENPKAEKKLAYKHHICLRIKALPSQSLLP